MADSTGFERINVAIRPPLEVEKLLVDLAGKIDGRLEAFFKVDGVSFYPHITLYSPEYPLKNFSQVLDSVKRIAGSFLKFEIMFEKIKSDWGYLGGDILPSKEIIKLHQTIVLTLNPFRDGHLREKYGQKEEMAKFSGQQQEKIKKYGYPDVMNLYRPHLNLARLKNASQAKEVAEKLNCPIVGFTAEKITAFKMGKYGTCIKIIKEFSLK